jgi:peptidoglycan-N-acetylglucosamine deacetylase
MNRLDLFPPQRSPASGRGHITRHLKVEEQARRRKHGHGKLAPQKTPPDTVLADTWTARADAPLLLAQSPIANTGAWSPVWQPPWWSGWLHVPVGLVSIVAFLDLGLGRVPELPEFGLVLLVCGLIVMSIVNLRTQALAPAFCGPRPGSMKRVALTFDDGPDPETTPLVLEALGNHRATFFVVGQKARAHPELISTMQAAGHLIASHGDRHCWRAMTSVLRARQLIVDGAQTLRDLGIEGRRFFRPPYGLMIPPLAAVAREAGVTVVGWSRRSLDTIRSGPPDAFAVNLAARVQNGDIVLLHDAPEHPGGRRPLGITATGRLITELEAKGFEFVTVDELYAATED